MAAAKLHVIVPAITAFPSGGNVFNARVLDGLAALPDAPKMVLRLMGPGENLAAVEPGTRVLVDTLLLTETDAALTRAGRRGLLVHHLELFDPATRTSPRARLERHLLEPYSFFIATSHWSARALGELGVTGECQVVHPGLDPDFLQRPLLARGDGRTTRVLTVANLIPRKGLLELARALSALAGAGAEFSWTVVGSARLDPTYARRLLALCAELGLKQRMRVIETASSEAMRALYDTSDLLVSGARFETLGMSLREGMARGLPVLAWDVGGCNESVRDAESGYLVPSFDDETYAQRLQALIVGAELRSTLGACAREQARSFPDWQQVQARFAAALRRLMD